MLDPGMKFKPKNTAIIRKCGLNTPESMGTILLAKNGFISFRLTSGGTNMEARTTDELFKAHFQLTGEQVTLEPETELKKHFGKDFPVEFVK